MRTIIQLGSADLALHAAGGVLGVKLQ